MSAEYHPELSPLSWLFGVWESIEAVVSYPTMETIKYEEIVEFLPTMNPVLEYKSETWHSVKKIKLHCERGFFKIDPESKKVALLVSHHYGAVEISEGFIGNESLSLESDSIAQMSFSKVTATKKIVREWVLKGEELHSNVYLGTSNQPLQIHLVSRYIKKK